MAQPGRAHLDLTADAQPLHPCVGQIVRAFEYRAKQPLAAALGQAALERWTRELASRRRERRLFEHLLVMALRLEEKGFTEAPTQLRSLGALGFSRSQLQATLARLEARPTAPAAPKSRRVSAGLEPPQARVAIRPRR